MVGVVCGPAQYPRGAVATAMPFNRKLDGGWVEEYKPAKSTRLHKWLQDAKEGKVFNGQKPRTKQWLIKPTNADVDQIKNPIDIEKK